MDELEKLTENRLWVRYTKKELIDMLLKKLTVVEMMNLVENNGE